MGKNGFNQTLTHPFGPVSGSAEQGGGRRFCNWSSRPRCPAGRRNRSPQIVVWVKLCKSTVLCSTRHKRRVAESPHIKEVRLGKEARRGRAIVGVINREAFRSRRNVG